MKDEKPRKRRRIGLKILAIVVLLISALLFFLSDIAKWYIENNGEKLIGRKISIAGLSINYLKCSITANDFVLYEQNGTDRFAYFEEFVIDIDPTKLLQSQYALSELQLKNFGVSIVSDINGFNFDDILEHLDSGDEDQSSSSDTIKYLIKNLSLSGGSIRYEDKALNTVTEMNNVGLNIPEIAWDNTRSDLGLEFGLGEHGKVHLKASIDQAKAFYEINATTEQIDISPFKAYFSDYIDAGSITGKLNSDISIKGSLIDLMKVAITGEVIATDVMITDPGLMPFMSIEKISVELKKIDMWRENYEIGFLEIENPKIITTLNSNAANYDIVLAPYWADTIPDINDTIEMHYSVDELIIRNGSIAYSDYTLNRPFLLDISELNFFMHRFTDEATRVPMEFNMKLNNDGKLTGKATVNTTTFETFFLEVGLKDLDMIFLSPYSEYFLARPILKGTMNYDASIYMNPVALDSQNHFHITDLDMGKKTKDTTAYKVPIGLALYILKDRNDVIDFDVPVTGNPADPKFNLRKVIWKTIEEFFIKTVAAPFQAIGKAVGGNPEKIKQISFNWLQDSLTNEQQSDLDKIIGFINKKDELAFVFTQTTDPDKEKEMLAVYETKLMYLRSMKPDAAFSDLKKELAGLPDSDTAFVAYLGLTTDADSKIIAAACIQKYTPEKAQLRLNQLLSLRENLIKSYFTKKNVEAGAYSFTMIDFRNLPAEMKTPKFIIDVTLR